MTDATTQDVPSARAAQQQAPRRKGSVSRRRRVWRRFIRSAPGAMGLGVMVVLIIVAVGAPLITTYDPLAHVGDALQTPNSRFFFGTDELGRDIFTRTVYGTRLSLETAFGAALISCVVGVPLGIISGYLGKMTDAVIMRITDVVLSVPTILFALIIVALLGSGVLNLTLAIAMAQIPAFIRLARASTLGVRDEEYVLAARSIGASKRDIMSRTIFRNILPPIFVQLVVTSSIAILVAAALSFIGLGVPPPAPSWGGMLQDSRSYLHDQIWYAVLPGVALAITIAALDAVGRGLQSALGTQSGGAKAGAMG